jgi:hypothetical protein
MRSDRSYSLLLRLILAAPFIAWAVLIPAPGHGGMEQEIDHLLNFIEESGCMFIRNSKEYKATEARDHIENKYAYIKRWVKKTEDFIKYAATKSSMTGKSYLIRCNGRDRPSAEWLQDELNRIRKQRNKFSEEDGPLKSLPRNTLQPDR